jgi:hypothetical protein
MAARHVSHGRKFSPQCRGGHISEIKPIDINMIKKLAGTQVLYIITATV